MMQLLFWSCEALSPNCQFFEGLRKYPEPLPQFVCLDFHRFETVCIPNQCRFLQPKTHEYGKFIIITVSTPQDVTHLTWFKGNVTSIKETV